MTPLGSFLDATAFLTRVPTPPRRDFDLARAAWAFPLVGALVGAVVGVVAVGTSVVAPPLVAVALAVLAEVLLTGALHLDGLADCADGCGGRDRESRLRIMKDHATGVYGVTAVVLDLLLKVALLHALLVGLAPGGPGGAGWGAMAWGDGWAVVALTAAVWAGSRTAILPLAGWLPYARAEGTGRSLVTGLTRGRVFTGMAVGVVLVGLLATGAGALALGALLVGMAIGTAAIWSWTRRALGGVTGDVLGATAEVVTLCALMALVIVSSVASGG